MIARGELFACDRLAAAVATAAAEGIMTSHQQGVWVMRFVIGLIVGVALTIGGAAIHDNMEPGASSPLVNWTTANGLRQTTVDYVRGQFDRLVKWVTSS
jgi:hypothetical protein